MLINILSNHTAISPENIYQIIANKKDHYKKFYIRKRNGEKRLICTPNETLSILQTAIVKIVFMKYKCSKNNTAYETGCSTISAARKHCGAKVIIKADIKNFFGSINYSHIDNLLRKKYSSKDIDLIWEIISFERSLPIGAPSSPFVCNRIMLTADKKIAKAAKKCRYTRYSDDLTFSSNKNIDFSAIIDRVEKALIAFDFKLNYEKTKIKTKANCQKVLGIVLNNNKLSIGLKKRKKFKKDIYNYLVKNKGNKARLKGKINYFQQVEPDFIDKITLKYAKFGYSKNFKSAK